jgi:hypothetical protein
MMIKRAHSVTRKYCLILLVAYEKKISKEIIDNTYWNVKLSVGINVQQIYNVDQNFNYFENICCRVFLLGSGAFSTFYQRQDTGIYGGHLNDRTTAFNIISFLV